jgi:hypothetical protein
MAIHALFFVCGNPENDDVRDLTENEFANLTIGDREDKEPEFLTAKAATALHSPGRVASLSTIFRTSSFLLTTNQRKILSPVSSIA